MTEYIRKSVALHAVLHNEGQAVVAAIEAIKPEDVAPMMHGEWIVDEKRFGNTYKHCSRCRAILEKDDDEWRNNFYCYHCGAIMDGGKNGK